MTIESNMPRSMYANEIYELIPKAVREFYGEISDKQIQNFAIQNNITIIDKDTNDESIELIRIEIINNIEAKVNEYTKRSGVSKVWIASRMGISKQALYGIFRSTRPTIDNLELISIIIGCRIDELYSKRIY